MELLLLEPTTLDCGLQTTQNDISGWATPKRRTILRVPPPKLLGSKQPGHGERYSAVHDSGAAERPPRRWTVYSSNSVPTRVAEDRVQPCPTIDLTVPKTAAVGRQSLDGSLMRRVGLPRKLGGRSTLPSPKLTSRVHFTKEVANFQAFLAVSKLRRPKPSPRYPMTSSRRRASQYHFDRELTGVSVLHKTMVV